MEVVAAILLSLAVGVTLAALFAVLAALFPDATALTRETVDAQPRLSFGVGLVNFLFLGAVGLVLAALGDGGAGLLRLLAVIVLTALTALLAFGLTGMVDLLGQRLFPDRTPLRRRVYAAVALTLACLTPGVGWFLLFPYVGLLGLGGFLVSRYQLRRADAEAEGA